MMKSRKILVVQRVAAAVLIVQLGITTATGQKPSYNKQRVTYRSGGLTLVGFVYKPDGPGPFPTVIWNHGSEKNPGDGPQFDSVAEIFVPVGYAVFAPTRRGHGTSEGIYIADVLNAPRRDGLETRGSIMVRLLETEQLEDQFAGILYAKSLSFVDQSRMVVAGCSFGGIQTLLAAERDGTFKAALPISPAAQTWDGNPEIRNRLTAAVRKITIPVLLIQPPKDDSLGPARVLGEEAKRARRVSFTAKVYPPTMPSSEQGHCFGGAKGMHNWGAEAAAFFDGVLGRRDGAAPKP
jgi:carboxymethylenebutenolidase